MSQRSSKLEAISSQIENAPKHLSYGMLSQKDDGGYSKTSCSRCAEKYRQIRPVPI
jgi:hypothetical protein